MVSTNLAGWEARDQIATDQIEAKRKILEAQGISLDMGFIQKLTKDAASAKQSLINLAAWKTELARLEKERIIIVRRRWAARGRIAIVAFRVRRKIDLGFSLFFDGPQSEPQIQRECVFSRRGESHYASYGMKDGSGTSGGLADSTVNGTRIAGLDTKPEKAQP
jgi:hypothetical protein